MPSIIELFRNLVLLLGAQIAMQENLPQIIKLRNKLVRDGVDRDVATERAIQEVDLKLDRDLRGKILEGMRNPRNFF